MLKRIEAAGRTCYKSEDRITEDSAIKFIKAILTRNHESVIEHESLSVRFICDRGCCYSDDTEVLTVAGWKKWPDVSKTDLLACKDNDGNLIWNLPSKLHAYDYNGNLLSFSNTCIDLLVTPNHMIWAFDHEKRCEKTRTWKFLRADEMTNNRYGFSKTANWNADNVSITIPAHPTKYLQYPEIRYNAEQSADLLELLGIWITDGSYRYGNNRGGSCINISQTKSRGVNRITELCNILGLHIHWYKNEARIDNVRLVSFVESLFGSGAKTFSAFVPDIIKNAASWQIQRFLDGVVLGDGSVHRKNKHVVVYSASKRFCDDLQECWMKVGLSANIRTLPIRIRGEILGNVVHTNSQQYIVSVCGKKRSTPLLVKKCAKTFATPTPYIGKVYCAEVPYHRLYVRRNGKAVWCGNSHELVRHRIASFSQESTRYCCYSPEKKGMSFVIPPWVKLQPCEVINFDDEMQTLAIVGLNADATWLLAMKNAEENYNTLLNLGWKPEQARTVLPNSLKTEIVMTANLREWRRVLSLRTSTAAHPQMREIMVPLLTELRTKIPVIFDNLEAVK